MSVDYSSSSWYKNKLFQYFATFLPLTVLCLYCWTKIIKIKIKSSGFLKLVFLLSSLLSVSLTTTVTSQR